mmetsp:Transcript_10411/g.15319  ORF Transcript_10411/g.15319 Transcript_10411/m.15319 type:complete len:169 (+) Transcript_10411:316-822(+)
MTITYQSGSESSFEVDDIDDEINDNSVTSSNSQHSQSQISPANNNSGANESDDDMTVIGLDHDPEQGSNDQQSVALAWIEQNGPEMEERRRDVLIRELRRAQRLSFIHFILLCLIPTSLLVVVIATVLGENEECNSNLTNCESEDRSFMNVFTTRCICEAVEIDSTNN